MAINNYIKQMQDKIEATKTENKVISDISKAKDLYKNKFIFNCVLKHLNDDTLTLDQAQQFVRDNREKIEFKVNKLNNIDEEWLVTIDGISYKTVFKVNTKKEV